MYYDVDQAIELNSVLGSIAQNFANFGINKQRAAAWLPND